MRRTAMALAVALTASAALTSSAQASPAQASPGNGEVLVFTVDLVKATVFEDPRGCHELPLGAHVLINRTNRPIKIFPTGCFGIGLTIGEGVGIHVPPAMGAFRA